MANKFTIFTKFQAQDKMTKTVKRMTKAVAGFAKIGIAAVGVGLALTAREFANYEHAITSSSAKFGDLNLATVEGQKQLKALGQIARDVGAKTQFSATEAAQGLDYLAMAGFSVQQAIVGLPQVIDLATVGNMDLARATDISSDALGAFNMMTKDSTQLQKNMTKINDVMAKTITSSNTDLETLFETIKNGAPSFTAAGQSIESFNALAGAMANAGVKGQKSGIALKNVMLKLANPTGVAAKIIKDLGVRTQDSSGNFRDVIDILADFEKGLKGMGTAQKTAALATVFGARTVTGINILLSTGSDALREYRKSLKESTGAAAKMADIVRGTLINRLKALKSTVIELGFKFIESFAGPAGEGIKSLTEAIRNINVEPIKRLIAFATPLVKTVINIAKELHAMFTETASGTKIIDLLGSAFKAIVPAVELMWKVVKPILQAWLWFMEPIFDIINGITKGMGMVAEFMGGGKGGPSMADYEAAGRGRAPMSPNTGLIESRSTTTNRSTVDVNFNNPPAGTAIKQKGKAPDVNLNLGVPSGLAGVSW